MFNLNRWIKLTKNYLSTKLIFAFDIFISVAASYLSILIIGNFSGVVALVGLQFLVYMLLSVFFSGLMFYFSKTYRIIIRHLSIKDIVPFVFAIIGKTILTGLVFILVFKYNKLMLLLLLLDFMLSLFLLVGIRLFMIVVYNALSNRIIDKYDQQRLLVFGTTNKSVATILRLQASPHYKVVGFIQNSGDNMVYIERLPVFSFNSVADFRRIVDKQKIDAVLFTSVQDAKDNESSIITYCGHHGIKTLITPNVDDALHEEDNAGSIKPREILVEDLLDRDEIIVSLDKIKENFSGKVVLVTGAAGSIGAELCRQLAGFGVKLLLLYDDAETPMHNLRLELEDHFPELKFIPIIGDVRLKTRLDYVFRKYHPQIVFHAAAYKHVPLMEENPCEAVMVNVVGTRNVADKCIQYNAEKMVMISTDKAVNPTNIMGCTKRLAEIYVQSLGLAIERGENHAKTIFVTTRFGNVLGSNGSVIPRFKEQIEAGGPVTVTHPDIIRYFMTIPEACRLVMEAATMSTSTQIFVFDMGKPVKIDHLARRMITLAGFIPDEDIKITYTGLRPGEKLYEEVLSSAENTMPSFHERIRIAKVREYDNSEAAAAVSELETYARAVEIPEMVKLMKKTVPEYKSDNSEFSKYDYPSE